MPIIQGVLMGVWKAYKRIPAKQNIQKFRGDWPEFLQVNANKKHEMTFQVGKLCKQKKIIMRNKSCIPS